MCTVVNKQFEKINRWTIFFIKVTLPFIRGGKIKRSNLLNNNNMVSKSVTSNIFVQLGGHPITNSQLLNSVYLLPQKTLLFFLSVENTGQHNSCQEKSHLQKGRSNTAPRRLTLASRTLHFLQCFTLMWPHGVSLHHSSRYKSPSCSSSLTRSNPHALTPPHVSFCHHHRERTIILPITVAFFTDNFRRMFSSSHGQNSRLGKQGTEPE